MNLHEYQAKQLLKNAGVPVQEGVLATSVKEAMDAALKLQVEKNASFFVVKAQVHAGGRGKGGGIKLAKGIDEVKEKAEAILGMKLVTPQTGEKGKIVHKLMIAEDVYYPGESEVEEYYISLLLDRNTGQHVLVYSPCGGVDIEETSHATPEKIFKEQISPLVGLTDFQCRKVAFDLGLSGAAFKGMLKFLKGLYKAFIDNDAAMVEINPVLKTSDSKILAVDAKVGIEDNALFRQPAIVEMRDLLEEDPAEIEASSVGLSFVKLTGNVGCMVNGAGLAMATMDMIKQTGGDPANFLDIGGSADEERVETGLKIIFKDPNVEGVLINVFGGIVKCDLVARGVLAALKNNKKEGVPIIARLRGTNSEEGKRLFDESGLPIKMVSTLEEAAVALKEAIR